MLSMKVPNSTTPSASGDEQRPSDVAEKAAEWVYRLQSSEAERIRPAFSRWYGRSSRHRQEFELACKIEHQMDSLVKLPADVRQRLMEQDMNSAPARAARL